MGSIQYACKTIANLVSRAGISDLTGLQVHQIIALKSTVATSPVQLVCHPYVGHWLNGLFEVDLSTDEMCFDVYWIEVYKEKSVWRFDGALDSFVSIGETDHQCDRKSEWWDLSDEQ